MSLQIRLSILGMDQKAATVSFLQKFSGRDEDMALESHAIYARLPMDDARPPAGAIKAVLEQQGKPALAIDRAVDPTVIEKVPCERK